MILSVVFGTRPEVIKFAPVIREARRRGHQVKVIITGQHKELLLPLLSFFKITPDLDLDVMTPNQTLTTLSERILHKLNLHKEAVSADYLLVQGDTTSAFLAAYWAFCHKIPVGHVEAGLRTYDLMAPFPEEANRQLIGRIAQLHFAPTTQAAHSLESEKVASNGVYVVGNTAIDALHYTLAQADKVDEIPVTERLDPSVLEFVGDDRMILVTAHRRENHGTGLQDICRAIRRIADANAGVKIVYPVHPNPNVRRPVEELLSGHPRVLLCNPAPYAGFVSLMKRADVLLTDSGGVQEEGPTLRKPILVMRESTERPEGVAAGFAKLVGTDVDKIVHETQMALEHGLKTQEINPYGDGRSAERIVTILESQVQISAGLPQAFVPTSRPTSGASMLSAQ